MTYNWDLIESLLHEVQNSGGGSFDSHEYATAKASEGEVVADSGSLQAEAGQLKELLINRGFIQSRPAEESDGRSGLILTPRGSSLLALIDSSIPGNDHPREVLDRQEDGLDPATFDEVASKPQVA
ncbi:transcriptional regulator [Pseudomonas floridensis]|uniref:Transcriptional regulator n=1 Tax=Pseudomonas floridensis TaxID=1958950 RepID=A0A1X0MZN9_9PSED|nr:transcriptional regulator [Pseudomonas floridensis]ORC55193.1 transcriptional regulator [Pseudomonas floridensis]